MRLSDGELVARCREGDELAWRELVRRFAGIVYAVSRRAFGLRAHDAEEVFQEVFARTYEHLGDLREPDAVAYWIKQITRRLCVDRLRMRSEDPLPEADGELLTNDDEELEAIDDAMAARQALDSLPDPCREILDRFFCRDETYQAISSDLGLPYGTIASRISRGLEKLRRDLEADGFSRQPGRDE
jgi:RNA polymerase sigma factor (sigma-70 family)